MKKTQRRYLSYRYLSYLLRLWQTSDGKKQIWRASLESPGTGERRGFASLKDLFGFLQAQTTIACGSKEPVIETPAAEMNLSAADIGPAWSLLEEGGTEDAPELNLPHVQDANMRMFGAEGVTGMVMGYVFTTKTVASAEQEMATGDVVSNFTEGFQKQMPGMALETMQPPDVGDEAVMVGGSHDELGLNVYMLTFTVGTAFTYQGRLTDGGSPANGHYDFKFQLYDAASDGNPVGSTVAQEDVAVSEGLFTVQLDFGTDAFTGEARWLEIGVRPGSGGTYTILSPRQPLTPAPYALGLRPGAVIAATPCTWIRRTITAWRWTR